MRVILVPVVNRPECASAVDSAFQVAKNAAGVVFPDYLTPSVWSESRNARVTIIRTYADCLVSLQRRQLAFPAH